MKSSFVKSLSVIFLLFFFLSSSGADGEKLRLAVAPFEVSGGIEDPSVGDVVADLILCRLSDKFELYERTLLKKLLDEKNLNESDVSEAKPEAVKAMSLKGVHLLVVGQVAKLKDRIIITARVVETRTGKVLSKGDISVDTLDALPDEVDSLLDELRLSDGLALGEKESLFRPDQKGYIGVWAPLTVEGAPSARTMFTMTRCGDFVVVWGGVSDDGYLNDGARFDIKRRVWLPLSKKDAPSPRAYHTAVWTGKYLVVWGGIGRGRRYLNDGARYDPVKDDWQRMKTPSFFKGRCLHAAVWTGEEVLLWGGKGEEFYGDGALYDPEKDEWRRLPLDGVPPRARVDFAYALCGDYFIVWGGMDAKREYLGSGAVLNIKKKRWRRIADAGAPSPRRFPLFCSLSKGLFIAGGETPEKGLRSDVFIYDPASDSWSKVKYDSLKVRPFGVGASVTLCGDKVVIWGGLRGKNEIIVPPFLPSARGYAYSTESKSWFRVEREGAPAARSGHRAVFCGDFLLVWGGWTKKGGKSIRLGNGALLLASEKTSPPKLYVTVTLKDGKKIEGCLIEETERHIIIVEGTEKGEVKRRIPKKDVEKVESVRSHK